MRMTGIMLAIISVLLVSCGPTVQRPARFPDAATVQLFFDNSDLEGLHSVDQSMNIVAGPVLSDDQRRRLEEAVYMRPIDPGEAFAACFVPHHFFRYLDAAGREIGTVSVCFCCAGVQISSDPSSMQETEGFNVDTLKDIVRELGVSTDLGCDPEEIAS